MSAKLLSFTIAIVADQPDTVERHVKQMGEYLRGFGGFVSNAAVKHPNEFVIAVATIFVAIFTAALAVATIRLWNSTAALAKFAEQQALDMKASIVESRRAADAAIKSAEAAERAARISEESFRRIERPYLFIKFITTQKLRSVDQADVASLEYTLVNYGKTPAVLRSIAIGLQDNPDWPLRTPMAIADESYDVIEPGGKLAKDREVSVAGGKPGMRYNGANAQGLILHGYIDYEDPTGAYHHDKFCMRGVSGGNAFRIDGGDEHNSRETTYPNGKSD
jgi:hypothetical protein